MLNRYVAERLLYRLASSRYHDELVLKGASLFWVWGGPEHRATRDIDLLGRGDPSLSSVEARVREVISAPVDEDGAVFPLESLRSEVIRRGQIYQGVRVTCRPRIGSAVLCLQVDIGFGDDASTERLAYPSLLDGMPAATLTVYTRESAIAEKLHAMVDLDLANTRMKDFFDVYYLASTHAFELGALASAIRATFRRRSTTLPTSTPTALGEGFASNPTKNTQWNAFLRKGGLVAPDLATLIAALHGFLAPALERSAGPRHWPPGGPWA